MPFAYYGAKHGLARRYPPPAFGVIVEPFAGSAAYSVHHAASVDRVVLVERDPAVVALWRRVKALTHVELDEIDALLDRSRDDRTLRTDDPLLGGLAGSSTLHATLSGATRQITPRMRSDWPKVRARIERTLPHLHKFELVEGAYVDAPDIEATWHIDPPYQPLVMNSQRTLADQAGNAYRFGADQIDYAQLGDWCRSRRGLVMVCEQSPAEWLPFFPLAHQSNGAGTGGATRLELIWRNDVEQPRLF